MAKQLIISAPFPSFVAITLLRRAFPLITVKTIYTGSSLTFVTPSCRCRPLMLSHQHYTHTHTHARNRWLFSNYSNVLILTQLFLVVNPGVILSQLLMEFWEHSSIMLFNVQNTSGRNFLYYTYIWSVSLQYHIF